MTPEQMLYEFELSADKVSSKSAMNLPLPAKLAYLNRGQLSLVLNRYSGNNATRTGFEESEQRREDLQVLVEPEEELKVAKERTDVFSAAFCETSKPFLILLRQYGYGSKASCKRERLALKTTQIDDLEEALADPFRKPDFQWREALCITAQDKLWVYTKDFTLDSVVISYLRRPRQIDMVGYIHFDGSESKDIACELPEYLHPAVIQEAVANLKADLGDPAYQTAIYKVAKSE